MLTSKVKPRIIELEIITNYNSLIDNSVRTIKIEISFRNKLRKPTKRKPINHKFIDALGQPILKENVEIEVIDLAESFAEKFRALVIRKNIAIRDIYDIYFILKKGIIKINKEMIDLILIKITESKDEKFSEEDLIRFIENLDSKLSELDEKEISSILKSDEKVDVKKMIQAIIKAFQYVRKI